MKMTTKQARMYNTAIVQIEKEKSKNMLVIMRASTADDKIYKKVFKMFSD